MSVACSVCADSFEGELLAHLWFGLCRALVCWNLASRQLPPGASEITTPTSIASSITKDQSRACLETTLNTQVSNNCTFARQRLQHMGAAAVDAFEPPCYRGLICGSKVSTLVQ